MNRIDLINNITRYLTILKTEVELRNALNLQDINVHAETYFRLLLNLLLELDLKNINIVDRNATAIDLGTMSRASPSCRWASAFRGSMRRAATCRRAANVRHAGGHPCSN